MEPPHLLLRTLISFGSFCLVANQVCHEGSGGYTLINNPRRSSESVHNDAVYVPLCDHGISEDTWFRFYSYSGDAIVERPASKPVPILHCGTQAPIYIRGIGSHPVANNTNTTATVCANYGGSDSCKWNATIQIYRCPFEGDPNYYYLYKLKSPPGCSLAYCAGDKAMCEFGDHWNGFSCVDYLPVMELPIFSEPRTTNDSGTDKEIFFTCEVRYVPQPNDSYARFLVTFLFDGLPLEDVPVGNKHPERLESTLLYPNSSMVVVLDELHLRGRLGKKISCQVESYWDGSSESTSRMRSNTSYYAAFESTAQSYSISLTNSSAHNVTFKSTLPFTCHHCDFRTDLVTERCCKYMFRMVDFTASTTKCAVLWTGNNTAVVTVYFLPEVTQVEKSFALVFQSYTEDEIFGGLSLWRDYLIPKVKMTIVPQTIPYKYCHSVTDPHFVTFDGAPFNNYVTGDMYLVKAINEKQHLEIQVRQEACNGGHVTCNCGVIIREGNSAFKISICEAGSWSSTVQRSPTVVRLLSQDPEDAAAVYMDATGLKFSVRMPSGLRVEVDATVQWFSVYVYLPPEYFRKTDSASMCGNSDGSTNGETNIDPHSGKFRIPDSLSYFRHPPNCSAIFNVPATSCGCNGTNPVCSNTDPTLKNISPANDPFLGNWTSGAICRLTPAPVLLSSLYDDNVDSDFILDSDILFPPYTYDPNFGANVSFTWPTPSNKQKEEVEDYCTRKLQSSPVYEDCSANADFATGIAMCVSDIQIVDDWLPISAYASFFEQNCLNNVAASITSTSDSANDELTSISGKLCPNNCTDNGRCSDGTCTCNSGFIGADCSIDKSRPPSLTGIIRGGVCDVRARPCDVISVYGSGVAISSALKCRFTDQNTDAHSETKGTFITAAEYSCPVPETTTHRRRRSATERTSALSVKNVSITIDGSQYSNSLDFVLFDSVCMECNTSDTCRQTENSCLITDECFADMAFNPSDACLQCIPSTNINAWINVTVVEDWSPCTRDCDTGVASKKTTCGTTVANEEIEFCKELDCPDNAEEKSEGVGITLSSGDLELILLDPVGSLVPFSDALNQYCTKNAAACCSSIGMETHASAVAYTSPDLLTYASGYPDIKSDNASLKVIVKIDRAKLAAECSQTPVQGSNILYGASNLLYDAVTSEKSEIEKALSINITSVWSSTALPSATPRTSTSVSTIYSLICLWVLVLVWNKAA